MKNILISILAVTLLVLSAGATEISKQDAKWAEVVKKMMAKGETKLSTPSNTRVEIIKDLAKKSNRECRVAKKGVTYEVVILESKTKAPLVAVNETK